MIALARGLVRVLTCGLLLGLSAAGVPQDPEPQAFRVVELIVDSGSARLGAWQLEFVDPTAVLVGVEGGDAAAFREPPRYDPAALSGGRVILAALASGDDLPVGRVVVARLHLMTASAAVAGEPTIRGVVAARADGARLDVRVTVAPRGNNR